MLLLGRAREQLAYREGSFVWNWLIRDLIDLNLLSLKRSGPPAVIPLLLLLALLKVSPRTSSLRRLADRVPCSVCPCARALALVCRREGFRAASKTFCDVIPCWRPEISKDATWPYTPFIRVRIGVVGRFGLPYITVAEGSLLDETNWLFYCWRNEEACSDSKLFRSLLRSCYIM